MKRPIPQYVDEMADGAVSRLNNLKTDSTVSFAFITDTHNCTDYTERALYAISKINEKHPIAFTCFGGDYLCNNSSTLKENAILQHKEMREAIEAFEQNPPMIIVKGNHDDNVFGELKNVVPQNELYDILFEHNDRFVTDKENPKSAYGYYDMPDLKLRAIYLDSIDRNYETDKNGTVVKMGNLGFGNRQLNWFAHEALNLPDKDWAVVLFSHIMPISTHLMFDRPFGGEALWNILCAFKDGKSYKACEEKDGEFYDVSCDFSDCGNVVAFITGHEHADRTCMTDGIRIITVAAAASDNFCTGMCDNGRVQYKTRGSGEESAFSIFIFDRNTHKLSQIRCGAGDDYNVNF